MTLASPGCGDAGWRGFAYCCETSVLKRQSRRLLVLPHSSQPVHFARTVVFPRALTSRLWKNLLEPAMAGRQMNSGGQEVKPQILQALVLPTPILFIL